MLFFATSGNLSNSTAKVLTVLAWILTVLSAKADGECFGKLITDDSGTIESPNNGNEYGEAANCSWIFNKTEPNTGGNILTLTVVKLRNYFIIQGRKHCSGSYNLTVNGEQIKCDAYIRNADLENSYCYEFYSPSCPPIPTPNCKYSEQMSFPVNVTYFSDGRTDDRTSSETSNPMGFAISHKYTQCLDDAKQINITDGSGHIQSPNYGNNSTEYEQRANILWKFHLPSDGEEYMLILDVTHMKNYFTIGGAAICSGSYNLAINGKPTACDKIIDADNGVHWNSNNCYQFYSSSTCLTTPSAKCTNSYQTSFPINVTYFSDGRTDSRLDTSKEWYFPQGFKMIYAYIVCPPETTSESLTVSLQTNADESLPARSTSTEKDKTTPTPPRKQNLAPIIGGAAGGGVLLLVVLVVVVVCVIRKRNGGKEDNHSPGMELSQQQNQEDAPLTPSSDEANTQPIDAYATVGGATSINETSNAMYLSINNEGPSASNGEYATVGEDGSPPTEGRGTPITKDGTMPITGTDLYATVSKPSVVGVSTTEGVATSITGTDVYATVSKPSVKVPKLAESSDAVYSAVQKGGGNKGTVHYYKTTVDNVLYGSAT